MKWPLFKLLILHLVTDDILADEPWFKLLIKVCHDYLINEQWKDCFWEKEELGDVTIDKCGHQLN